MYSVYGDEDQRQKLNQLEFELTGVPLTQNKFDKMGRDINIQLGKQGIEIDTMKHRSMIRNSHQETDCELCHKLQADSRFILVNILNTQEIIKKDVRDLKIKMNSVGVLERDDQRDDFFNCCIPWSSYS
jgi:hypothetical protein